MRNKVSPEQIDQLLPQTQCGLCTHGGCLPYANAIIKQAASLNLCPPGGVETLRDLGKLMGEDVESFVPEMELKTKPPLVALIREAECIGCTKCIAACPVDAILGSAKSMHTVISDECTGCELCIAPCPVDCIDMVPAEVARIDPQQGLESNQPDAVDKRKQFRARFQARNARLQLSKEIKVELVPSSIDTRQSYIQEALKRAREKKNI